MDRASGTAGDDDVVALLPICIRRLRGPGRARRAPAGTAYRSAGAVLRRVLVYNENGQALVQVVRSSSDGRVSPVESGITASRAAAAAAAASTATSPSTTTAAAATAAMHSHGDPTADEVREEAARSSLGNRPTHLSSQDVRHLRTKSQIRQERAAALAAETERRYAAEQESTLAALLQALPLLRVVPPQSLLQQVYTDEAGADEGGGAGRLRSQTHGSGGGGGADRQPAAHAVHDLNVLNADGLPRGAAPEALRAAARARYGISASAGTVGFNAAALSASDSNSGSKAVIRDARGLRLHAAVLLTREETEDVAATAVVPPCQSAGGVGVQSVEATPPGSATATPDAAPASAVVASTPLKTPQTPSSSLTSEKASTPDAASVVLNGMLIDGGLGVTIKLGSSCDEPSSLRYVAWGGCRPVLLRAVVWRLLSDYAPVQVARQRAELQRKRRQYEGYTRQYCSALTMLAASAPIAEGGGANSSPQGTAASMSGGGGTPQRDPMSLSRLPGPRANVHSPNSMLSSSLNTSLAPHEKAILHQMLLDLPRHQSPVFHARRSVAGMARCLFLWSQRHPAVGYVQGMDDVVAVFYQVFLTDALRQYAREKAAQEVLLAAAAAAAAAQREAAHAGGGSHSDENTGLGSEVEMALGDSDERSTRAVMRLLLSSLSPTHAAVTTPNPSSPTTPAPFSASASLTTTGASAEATPERSVAAVLPLDSDALESGASPVTPYLTEADVDVLFRTPAALDAVLAELPESYLTQVEADTYVCAGRVLSFLQDNFMTGQPGILKSVRRLEALVRAVDPSLIAFLESYGLSVMDGCFQWLHCLLARELPLTLLLRLWDCYLAIGVGGDRPLHLSAGLTAAAAGNTGSAGNGTGTPSASDEAIMYFHVCVCCALLQTLRTSLVGRSAATGPAAATSAGGGGWAAALATVLPGFRSRGEGGSNSTASASSPASSCAAPSIDVVMTTLKRPFEAVFPNYPSVAMRRRRLDAARRRAAPLSSISAAAAAAVLCSVEESSEEAAAGRWLDVLIADAYCIWRQHPLPG